jgi:tetratricopeptide (TPR) repeat protein
LILTSSPEESLPSNGGQPEQQIAILQRVIEMNPSFAPAYANLGSLRALAGRPDDAIANLEKAMRLSPRDSALWLWLTSMGCAHFAAARYEEAVTVAAPAAAGAGSSC